MLKVCLTSNSICKLFASQSTTLVATSVHVRIDTIKAGKPLCAKLHKLRESIPQRPGLERARDTGCSGERPVGSQIGASQLPHRLICTGELWLVTKHNESEALETSKTVLETNKRTRLPSLLPRGICWPCFAQEAQQVGSQVGVQRPRTA